MMEPQTLAFDLWELAWWQQPAYIAALGAAVVLVLGCGALFVWWRRRALTAEERLLQHLATLQLQPATTLAEQKVVYTALTSALKSYGALLIKQPHQTVHSLTDEEFARLCATAAPRAFAQTVQQIVAAGCSVKFAERLIPGADIHTHLTHLTQFVAQQQREHTHNKKKQTSRT